MRGDGKNCLYAAPVRGAPSTVKLATGDLQLAAPRAWLGYELGLRPPVLHRVDQVASTVAIDESDPPAPFAAAFRAGRRAEKLALLPWEDHWETPVAEVRALLGIRSGRARRPDRAGVDRAPRTGRLGYDTRMVAINARPPWKAALAGLALAAASGLGPDRRAERASPTSDGGQLPWRPDRGQRWR